VRSAVVSPTSAIVLDIDSPGGSVFGVQELADVISARGALGLPPSPTPSRQCAYRSHRRPMKCRHPQRAVGSIGAFMRQTRVTRTSRKARTPHLPGKYKVEGNPDGP
jgi:ClpP class serine protease